MKSKIISVFLAACLLIGILALAACAATTVTVTPTKPAVTQTVTLFTTSRALPTETITMPPAEGTLTAEDAPLTPHTLLTYDACSTCHMVSAAHIEQGLMQEVCGTCHKEGPNILQIAGY